jgi:single-strand DNA-binding protein
MSINVVVLVGNAGRDPELRFFESGSCICEFSLAINRLPRDGQEQAPLWVNCKAWGKTAQVAGDYVRKGSKVAVVGRLEIEQWTDRSSGEVRSKTLVVVDRLELCGSRGGSDGGFIGGAEPSRAEHEGHPDAGWQGAQCRAWCRCHPASSPKLRRLGQRLDLAPRRRHSPQRRGGAVLMERSSRRLELPAFPRSRPSPSRAAGAEPHAPPEAAAADWCLLLQLGSIALLLRMALQVESTPPRDGMEWRC